MKITVRGCREANAEHRVCKRAYAHVGHRPNTICIVSAIFELPKNYIYGILLHELGHLSLMRQKLKHSELDADMEGGYLARVKLQRRTWRGRRSLEYVRGKDVGRAVTYLKRHTRLGEPR